MDSEQIQKILGAVCPKSPRAVLQQFALNGRADESFNLDRRPLLTIHCHDGQSHHGKLVSSAVGSGGAEFFVLAHFSGSGPLPENIIMVDGANVSGLTIHEFVRHADVLTDGKIANRSSEYAPSLLQLKRLLETINNSLDAELQLKLKLTVDWPSIDALKLQDQVHTALLNLRDCIEAVQTTLKSIAKDKVGVEALSKISTVGIGHLHNSKLEIRKVSEEIYFVVDLTHSLATGFGLKIQDMLSAHL